MLDWLKQLQSAIDQQKKYEEGYKEQVDVNINVTVMNEQIQILRDAMRETLSDVDPHLTMVFMAKLNDKMKALAYGSNDTSSGHSKLLTSALTGNIQDVDFE